LNRAAGLGNRFGQSWGSRGILHWLAAMPHPRWVCEIAPQRIAAARSARGRVGLEQFAIEPLPEGAIVPSLLEQNLAQAEAVRAVARMVLGRLGARGDSVALLVPDQALRVFVVHFDRFPANPEEALPLLRWRLKKSLPFDIEDTVLSYSVQAARAEGVDVVTALARRRVIRQYEEVAEAVGLQPGVVLGSTLATLPLVQDDRPRLVARLSGTTLTAVVLREGTICIYRCTEVSTDGREATAQSVLDELYPAVAYFQDTWEETLHSVCVAGLGERFEEFRQVLQSELGCPVQPVLSSEGIAAGMGSEAYGLAEQQLEPLVGWMANRGA